jgi:hypothetical protein
MLRHRRTKVAERAMQGVGQSHSVFVFGHYQVIESDKANRAKFLDAGDHWMAIELGKEASLRQDNKLARDLGSNIGQIACRQQCRQCERK